MPSNAFLKIINPLPKKQASILIQLRTGHAPLNQHLNRIGKSDFPHCPNCPGIEETVHHFMFECPQYVRERHIFANVLRHKATSISYILTKDKAIKPLMRYINSTCEADSKQYLVFATVPVLTMSWSVMVVDQFRPYVSFIILAFFLVFMFISGVQEEVKKHHVESNSLDFTHYAKDFIQELPDNLFPGGHSGNRMIVIGDIHGMNSSLTNLLDEVPYDPSRDTLIHLGDLVTKANISDSIHVLSFMTTNKILGVRGNNDQKVIEWRAWMDWVQSRTGGSEWLAAMDRQFPDIDGDHHREEIANWIATSKYADWVKVVPEGWRPLGQHYRVARVMSREHFYYLCSLPLVLHSAVGHLFLAHAGLLPSNPKLPIYDITQPLSHWPTATDDQSDIAKLRNLQELAILTDIPENKEPSVVMNIGSVTDDGHASASHKHGTPWSQLWNDTMAKCSGTGVGETFQPTSLPCYPFTVIYGHAASRGLDIKRWSVGLDTGCAHGHRLSALVLDERSMSPVGSGDKRVRDSLGVDFGDDGQAYVVSVECSS